MDIFDLLRFVGGLALFLYGMNVMGGSLEKLAGGGLKSVLERITSSPVKGVLLGTIITAIIQSSSATMVMVVGLVNSGIMSIENSIGIIMGSNIGTTATGWLLSLTGIDGKGSVLLQLCKPSSFVPVLAAIGVYLRLFDKKKDRHKDIGTILLGFAVLMFGMETMTDAMSGLKQMPGFLRMITVFENPIICVFIGIVVTALIQSVSASVGILQAMAVTGVITYGMAIPLIMGMSIGASTPVLLSAIGANANAKRSSVLYLIFNVLGTVACLILFYVLHGIFDFVIVKQGATIVGIALANTVFKLASTVILLPFSKQLIRVSKLCIKDKASDQKLQVLDERFLDNPGFAVSQCTELTVEMAKLSHKALFDAMGLLSAYNEQTAHAIVQSEDDVDHYEDVLGTFMVKLSARSMRMEDSRMISRLLHCIGDFERISDHALNIKETADEMHEKKLHFSAEATAELNVLYSAVQEIVNTAMEAFITNDVVLARRVEPLEQVIDELVVQLRARHITRLQNGTCTMLLGFVFSDLITNYERVADHCSNIAICMIETGRDSFETHEYLNKLTSSNDEEYMALLADFALKYSLN